MSTDPNRERVEALAEVIHKAYGCGPVPTPEGPGPVCAPDSEDRAVAQALLDSPAMRDLLAEAWDEGHAAGREYQGDGWNSDAHDPAEDNPYRQETA